MTGIQCFPHISFNLKGRKLPCFQRDLGCGLFSEEQKWWYYCLLTYVSTTHSIVLSRPLPLVAEVLSTCQLWSLQFITQVNMPSQNVSWLVLCPVYLLTVLMPFLSSSSSNMATNADLEMPLQSGHYHLLHKWLHLCLPNNISCMTWSLSVWHWSRDLTTDYRVGINTLLREDKKMQKRAVGRGS